jgi:hypothetical protein
VVVEHRQIGGQHHDQFGDPQVVGVGVGQLLQAPHDVVPEVAHHARAQRRQRSVEGGVQPLERRGERGQRVATVGAARRAGGLPSVACPSRSYSTAAALTPTIE